VAQQQQGLDRIPGWPETAHQQITSGPLFAALALPPAGLDPPLYQRDTAIYACPVFRGRLQSYQLGEHFEHFRPPFGRGRRQVAVTFHQSFSFAGKPNTPVVRLIARSVCVAFATPQRF
jgi:hypothetical protein